MQPTSSFHYGWNVPLPLPEGIPLHPWPLNVFPAPFDTFAKEIARSTETPIELSSMLTLASVAAAAQKNYKVQIKTDYSEPVNVWSLVVLPPASRKSRVFSEVTHPLREWEAAQKQLIEPEIQAANSRRKTDELRLKEIRQQAAKKSGDEYELLQKQIDALEAEMPVVLNYPQLWTSDVTPEHLGTIMSTNEEAMVVMSDEGGIFDILAGLYSDGKANIDLFLQAHAASSVRVDRGSRAPVFMQRPVLTMGLTIQPSVIKNICNNKNFRGRGLLGRFLFVLPKSNIGSRTFEEPPMAIEDAKEFQQAVKRILEHPPYFIEDEKSQHSLQLSPEAYSKWLGYAKVVEALMGDEIGLLAHMTDWAGKLPGAIARIAGLIHIMRYAYRAPWEHSISLEDMEAAVKVGHCLTNHALAVFDLLQQDTALQHSRSILKWIKEKKLTVFTSRDCSRKFRGIKKEERDRALEMLFEHEYIREKSHVIPLMGRQKEFFDVNPYVFDV